MNKKILFVESALSGHRGLYHKTLIESAGVNDSVLITPKEEDISCKQVVDKTINLQPRSFREYRIWLEFILVTAKGNNVEIIHILNGDLLYKFWGMGLERLSQYRTIVTYHHVKNDIWHNCSVKLIMKKIQTGIVHTALLKKRFEKISNIKLIHYPCLGNIEELDSLESKEYYKIAPDAFTLVALGGTRFDKGVDVLVKALNNVHGGKVTLLIAGEEEYFKKEELAEMNKSPHEIVFCMKHLTEDEWAMALSAADCVVLPYRKGFTGASGPLTDAVWFKRSIIGGDNESIGDIISSNHLGYVFECENEKDLSKVINQAITSVFEVDSYYEEFRYKISKASFVKKYRELYYIRN